MSENNDILQITEFDQVVNQHQLQMIKAAIPYVPVTEQKFISVFVKLRELVNTIHIVSSENTNTIGICSVEPEESSPVDMLNAMRKYADEPEKGTIDLILNFMQANNLYRSYMSEPGAEPAPPFGSGIPTTELLKNMLNPEQQSMLDTYQMLFQTMGQA